MHRGHDTRLFFGLQVPSFVLQILGGYQLLKISPGKTGAYRRWFLPGPQVIRVVIFAGLKAAQAAVHLNSGGQVTGSGKPNKQLMFFGQGFVVPVMTQVYPLTSLWGDWFTKTDRMSFPAKEVLIWSARTVASGISIILCLREYYKIKS
jgi:hypothetical protein